MKTRLLAFTALALGLVPAVAFAHPGHGHTDPSTWRHYLTEPLHVAVLAVAAAAVLVTWLAYRRLAQQRSQNCSPIPNQPSTSNGSMPSGASRPVKRPNGPR